MNPSIDDSRESLPKKNPRKASGLQITSKHWKCEIGSIVKCREGHWEQMERVNSADLWDASMLPTQEDWETLKLRGALEF